MPYQLDNTGPLYEWLAREPSPELRGHVLAWVQVLVDDPGAVESFPVPGQRAPELIDLVGDVRQAAERGDQDVSSLGIRRHGLRVKLELPLNHVDEAWELLPTGYLKLEHREHVLGSALDGVLCRADRLFRPLLDGVPHPSKMTGDGRLIGEPSNRLLGQDLPARAYGVVLVERKAISSEQRLDPLAVVRDRVAIRLGLLPEPHLIEDGLDDPQRAAHLVPIGPVDSGIELFDVRTALAANPWIVTRVGEEALRLEQIADRAQHPTD